MVVSGVLLRVVFSPVAGESSPPLEGNPAQGLFSEEGRRGELKGQRRGAAVEDFQLGNAGNCGEKLINWSTVTLICYCIVTS